MNVYINELFIFFYLPFNCFRDGLGLSAKEQGQVLYFSVLKNVRGKG